MKIFKRMVSLSLLTVLAVSVAHADDSEWGVGLKAGTLGIGAEARWSGLPYVDFRLGANAYTYSTTGSEANIRYDSDLDLETFFVTANFHFPLTPFRLTAGAFSNGNELNMVSTDATGLINIGGQDYPADQVGTLTSNTSFDSMAPYVGLGFDFELFGKAGINFDVGVLLQGDPTVTLAADGPLAGDTDFQNFLDVERQQLEDEFDDFKAYPVVSLSFVYNF